MRAYSGADSPYESCNGFFHLTHYATAVRTAFYREEKAFACDQGLPQGWLVAAQQVKGGRWQYCVYVPGEEPMPSVYTYVSRKIALAEAAADVLGESRTG